MGFFLDEEKKTEMRLTYKFIKDKITYTGRQLSSHWIYENFNIQGPAIVAFIGPARVKEHLVDMVDRKRERHIKSALMLHFISEYFDLDLEKTIFRQRLFINILAQEINKACGTLAVERKGNDLYSGNRKLSVAIATLTPVSCVFHVGLNVIGRGAPVEAIGLRDLSISAKILAEGAFELYNEELESITIARSKVRGVA